jgi:hypothetical protein
MIAVKEGREDLVKLLVAFKADLDGRDAMGRTALDWARQGGTRSHPPRATLQRNHPNWRMEQVLLNRGVDPTVLDFDLTAQVREAVAKVLADEERQEGRLTGALNDFKSGKFEDAANGIKPFIGVPDIEKECTVDGIMAEVKRLCDCPQCSEKQALVFKDMKRDQEHTLTLRLSSELSDLQKAREAKIQIEIERHQAKVTATRKEIEALGGWVYGSDKAKPVEWPDDSVKHDWGKYGQPMCDKCKELGLDYSTIWADIHYIYYEKASTKECFNGIRDKGHEEMVFADFMKLEKVKEANLSEAQLLALRFYTSHSFHAINKALRASHKPHPLPAIVMCIFEGLKALRALDPASAEATAVKVFYRGFTDMQVTKQFLETGGTEASPMSTTTDYRVACGYAVRKGATNGAMLMKIVTRNNLERGADLTFLSMFPGEAETLFPPLTFVQPTGKVQEMIFKMPKGDDFKLCIIEVTATLP